MYIPAVVLLLLTVTMGLISLLPPGPTSRSLYGGTTLAVPPPPIPNVAGEISVVVLIVVRFKIQCQYERSTAYISLSDT